jgi:hypothetical protein
MICMIRQSLARLSQSTSDVMNESNQFVAGLTPRHSPPSRTRSGMWVIAVSLLAGFLPSAQAGFAGLPSSAAVSAPARDTDNVTSATGNRVAAGLNPDPNIESRRSELPDAAIGSSNQAPVSLTGLDVDSLLPESGMGASHADLRLTTSADGLVQPLQVTGPRPAVIPFPTAAHLFIPGAVIAIYAARKMRPRYRRRA